MSAPKLTRRGALRLGKLAESLLAKGQDAESGIAAVVTAVDAAIDFVAIGAAVGGIGAAAGVLVEAVDGPIATLIARQVVAAAERRRSRRLKRKP